MYNLNLNYEGFDAYLVKKQPKFDGVLYQFRFENDYGASVIKHEYSYGSNEDLWELAVLIWRGDDCKLDYDTDITADVEGYLTDEDVRNLLQRIKDL